MKVIPLAILSILTISSTLSAATYTITSGLTQDILDIYGQAHPYSGPNLSAYVNTPNANLSYADLTGADLYRADLIGANLSFVSLWYAKLRGADLSGADLTGAYLAGAKLYGADLSGADLYSAMYVSQATWTNSNLFGATLPEGYDQAWFENEGAIFEETVPEPSSYALLLGGLALGLVALRRR